MNVMPQQEVTIRTGARLHFGPLSYQTTGGRHFGGIGVMIDRPGVELTVTTPAPRNRFGIHSPRAASMHDTLRAKNSDLKLPLQVDVAEEIPPHSGLGSGTQLALAMMDAMLRLHGREVSPEELALRCGRGDRSAIGLHGYHLGGFLVDAGHAGNEKTGTLACRLPFPSAWRIVLLHPADAVGLHGSLEMRAFRQLPPMTEALSGRLCRLTLTEIIPALSTQSFSAFTAALFEYGQRVGEFFSSTQGGVFASPLLRSLQSQIHHVEGTGMSQSSWGPTVAMFARNNEHAAELRRAIWSLVPAHQCRVEIVSARNSGCDVITSGSLKD